MQRYFIRYLGTSLESAAQLFLFIHLLQRADRTLESLGYNICWLLTRRNLKRHRTYASPVARTHISISTCLAARSFHPFFASYFHYVHIASHANVQQQLVLLHRIAQELQGNFSVGESTEFINKNPCVFASAPLGK